MKQFITPLAPDQVQITDMLFGSYVRLVSEKMVPYQWDALNDRLPDMEPSHCIDNFRVAAGDMPGRHQGAVFQDTDLYKWLEAVAFCIYSGTGRKYEAVADEVIDLIGRAQCPDGYLNTYITIECPNRRWENLAEGHELYGCGHLIEAAVAYYQATGKDKLLGIARRFADLVDRTFGPRDGQSRGVPGHEEIELALVKLFRATGERRYLELAAHFVRQRGQAPNYLTEEMKSCRGRNLFPEFAEYDDKYAQTHLPPVRQETAEGHAVRAVYLYSAMADLAMELQDDEMAKACEALYRSITRRRMYITGGIGSSGKLERFTADYDLPDDRMYCESCASVGLMMFAQRMALLTGDAAYCGAVELALHNTVLAGISKDGDRYFYVNPLAVWPDNCLPSTSMSHVKPVRQPWFACACCPPNIARTLASLAQYIGAADERSLYINLLISSRIRARVGSHDVKAELESTYMDNGKVRLTVESDGAAEIRLRVPEYLADPVFSIGGTVVRPKFERGYAVFPVDGRAEIEVSAKVAAHFVAANRRVRAVSGQVAMMKGPFVYCLEQTDNGENLPELAVRPDAQLQERLPEPQLPGALPTLAADGVRVRCAVDGEALYGEAAFFEEKTALKAVPYALWCNREPGEMRVWIRAQVQNV